MEFIKPIVEPTERQDFYFYTQKYPNGLKATVEFEKSYPPNENSNY